MVVLTLQTNLGFSRLDSFSRCFELLELLASLTPSEFCIIFGTPSSILSTLWTPTTAGSLDLFVVLQLHYSSMALRSLL